MGRQPLLPPFCRWENWGMGNLSHLLRGYRIDEWWSWDLDPSNLATPGLLSHHCTSHYLISTLLTYIRQLSFLHCWVWKPAGRARLEVKSNLQFFSGSRILTWEKLSKWTWDTQWYLSIRVKPCNFQHHNKAVFQKCQFSWEWQTWIFMLQLKFLTWIIMIACCLFLPLPTYLHGPEGSCWNQVR